MTAPATSAPPTHDQYASLAQQAQAVKLALGIFLASEVLMFSTLFALVMAYQSQWPEAFRVGIAHNTRTLGAINTLILIVSSTVLGVAVELHRKGRARIAGALALFTAACGVAFFVIKLVEYDHHFMLGIFPGGKGRFFSEHPVHGLATFWDLYYLGTGLHAVHIASGVAVVGYRGLRMFRGSLQHSVEAVALYWGIIDLFWLVLWTLFYVR